MMKTSTNFEEMDENCKDDSKQPFGRKHDYLKIVSMNTL